MLRVLLINSLFKANCNRKKLEELQFSLSDCGLPPIYLPHPDRKWGTWRNQSYPHSLCFELF